MRVTAYILCLSIIFSCAEEAQVSLENKLFTEIPSSITNITFQNNLVYNEEVNVYTFRNFYNGAGVGIGDFNNDGLSDIFFCGNQVDNKLYINKGDFEFDDITEQAGVASQNVWSTGVSLVDINADGWLDIYVCKSGDIKGENRHNELFINQGMSQSEAGADQISFIEQSKKYGLDDVGLSTHAAFFDYDRDGDLDCYLLNNSFKSVGNYDLKPGQREIRDESGGNKLFRNNGIEESAEGSIFQDVSEEAGIYGSAIGFGLGVTVGDVNMDGWTDIFVSNDFFEKDYLYINNQDGTFSEDIDEAMGELSMGSMGADLADINNDCYPDLFVTEMLPHDETRLKSKAQFQNWNSYVLNEKSGYHRQFARNVLQLNNGANQFSEIGRYANVEDTDWSWGALIFDMDNDGFKDLFVANGIFKDLLDQDYINFFANPAEVRKILFDKDNGGIDKLIDQMPSEALSNFAFKNEGANSFSRIQDEWGLDKLSFSNGSAYGDLDNDGDLDLVVNNINMPPMIYKNNLQDHHYIGLKLIDSLSENRDALGSKIYVFQDKQTQYQELNPYKGFMSTVDSKLVFGLGERANIDSIKIVWPDQGETVVRDIIVDTHIEIEKSKFEVNYEKKNIGAVQNFAVNEELIDFAHTENDYSDFDKEPLLFQMHSNYGPACCSGDINNDGRTDFYIGGAADQSGTLFLQNSSGRFDKMKTSVWDKHQSSEDVDCIFFDADNDGWKDLYVASGSSEFGTNNVKLADRLYFNKRGSTFEISKQILPTFKFENSSSVTAVDYDLDGDQDLIVSSFIKPYFYGASSSIYLLENDGSGNFQNVSKSKAPSFANIGMVTDVNVTNIDDDDYPDLVVVGEWMGIKTFINDDGSYKEHTTDVSELNGLWNVIEVIDLDDDGIEEYVVGNQGLNSRIKGTAEAPLNLYVNDFDRNGKADQIFSYTSDDKEYPLAQRNDLLKQIPGLAKRYPNFNSYAGQSTQEIFGASKLDSGIVKKVIELRSGIVRRTSSNNLVFEALPMKAQLSPIYAIHGIDVDDNKQLDLLLGGNQYKAKPELGINDGLRGLVLVAEVDGKYKALKPEESGIHIKGEMRGIVELGNKTGQRMLVARNNDTPIIIDKK